MQKLSRTLLTRRGGGGQGACGRVTTPCAQASQWGVWVSPQRVWAPWSVCGAAALAWVVRSSAVGSDGHTQASMRNTHRRAISAKLVETRWDTKQSPLT